MNSLLNLINALGGLAGIAAFVTALANLRQFRNNGGSSMKDQMDRIERLALANSEKIDVNAKKDAAGRARIWNAINDYHAPRLRRRARKR